jgi:hypothetical protein
MGIGRIRLLRRVRKKRRLRRRSRKKLLWNPIMTISLSKSTRNQGVYSSVRIMHSQWRKKSMVIINPFHLFSNSNNSAAMAYSRAFTTQSSNNSACRSK